MKKIVWLFWLLVFVVLTIFAITLGMENKEEVEISYYFISSFTAPVALLLIVPFFIGLLIGVVIMSFSVFKQKRRFSAEKRKLDKVEKEVENLRALPLKDEV